MSTDPTPPTNPSESITERPPLAPPPTSVTAEAPAPPPTPETPTPPTPAAPTTPPAWVAQVDLLLLALLLVLAFFLASFAAANSDVWLHLAVGKNISEGKHTFGVDPFSWATEASDGAPAVYWVNHSWLYSLLFYQLHGIVGGAGLVVIKALLIVIAIGLLSRIGWTETSRWFVLICLTLAVLGMSARLFLQPHIVSLLFLAITLFVLDQTGVFALATAEGTKPCDRCLWALPPLFVLWANLDHWFILGPLTVGLCWAGVGLARWFRGAGHVPAKTLGILFGVGLAACVLNPFHVRVFQLPPELAYLVLGLTDPLGIPLPDALVAGGRTLKELRRAGVDTNFTLSTVSVEYWKRDQLGFNIAALAAVPLLILGFGGFTLMALIKHPNAPTLHVGRFLIWLVFGVMALALYRLVPFFALVAGPLTALTLGEFLHWQHQNSASSREKRERGLNVARLLTIPFMLLLVGLAWPGHLYTTTEGYAPRAVAWELRADPALTQAALTLKDLKAKGECGNVFNVSYDIGSYLAWHAPEIKYGVDTRFPLFSQTIGDYAKARIALATRERPELDWVDLFKRHKVDQVVLANFFPRNVPGFSTSWWLDEEHWRFRYGGGYVPVVSDVKVVIFSWAGPDKHWPRGISLEDINRKAFGAVPAPERPPLQGTLPPTPSDSIWSFLEKAAPTTAEAGEIPVLAAQRDYYVKRLDWNPPMVWPVPLEKDRVLQMPARLIMSLAIGMPAAGDTTAFGMAAHVSSLRPWWMQPNEGPPGLPVLMMRTAWLGLAKNSTDSRSYLSVVQAVETLRAHENYATSEYGPNQLRDLMRRSQLITNFYHAAQLRPEAFELQEQLADLYGGEELYDMALEQKKVAFKALEAIKASGKADPRAIEEALKKHREMTNALEQKVKERLVKWRDETAGRPPLQKAAMAFGGRPMLGLAKKSLELLEAIPRESLKDNDWRDYVSLRFELLLKVGRADLVANALRDENFRKTLHPVLLANYDILAGAAVGDFELADRGLKVFEEKFRADWVQRRTHRVALTVINAAQYPAGAPFNVLVPVTKTLSDALQDDGGDVCNVLTLRGILALEGGDTKAARTHFQTAIDQAGAMFHFTDRPLAKRYLDLLNEQNRP